MVLQAIQCKEERKNGLLNILRKIEGRRLHLPIEYYEITYQNSFPIFPSKRFCPRFCEQRQSGCRITQPSACLFESLRVYELTFGEDLSHPEVAGGEPDDRGLGD